MSAGRTVELFGYYLIPVGLLLAFVPNLMLGPLGFVPATEVWIRVLGLVVAPLGAYYVVMGREHVTSFLWLTVYVRVWVFVAFALLAASGLGQPMLALFGLVDLFGAIWTWNALGRGARM